MPRHEEVRVTVTTKDGEVLDNFRVIDIEKGRLFDGEDVEYFGNKLAEWIILRRLKVASGRDGNG